MTQDTKTDILIAIFITALVAANLLGTKITAIFGVAVSVGLFAYPLTFLVTDIIEEVHGKEKSKNLIKAGFICLLMLLFLTWLSRTVPPANRYEHNEAYLIVFGTSLRMIIASLIAFLLSQNHDIWAFSFWKKKTNGRFLWLRNNASTWISQLIDTTIFIFIAFYHISPKFNATFLFAMILPYWLFKIIFATLDTPFVYLGVKWLKNSKA